MIRNSFNVDVFNKATEYLASNINLNNLQFFKIAAISEEKFTNTSGFGYRDLKLIKVEKKNKENFPLQENAFGYFYYKPNSKIAPPIKKEKKKREGVVPLELRRTRLPKNREPNSVLDFKYRNSTEKVIDGIKKERIASIKKEIEDKRITALMNLSFEFM